MPTPTPYATVCDAYMCTVKEVMTYKTVLPNGAQIQVHLCRFHALELEEADFIFTKERVSVE